MLRETPRLVNVDLLDDVSDSEHLQSTTKPHLVAAANRRQIACPNNLTALEDARIHSTPHRSAHVAPGLQVGPCHSLPFHRAVS